MSKAVLISILPNWVEKICSGEKTIEVRRTRPKIETPFKCYIYCTKQRMTKVLCMYSYLHINEPKASLKYGERITTWGNIGDVIVNRTTPYEYVSYGMQGKVIGEFMCERIVENFKYLVTPKGLECACLSEQEVCDYLGFNGGYGWHISDLKIYDKPKPIMQFYKPCPIKIKNCPGCELYSTYTGACMNNITRPPESWCYVEEI